METIQDTTAASRPALDPPPEPGARRRELRALPGGVLTLTGIHKAWGRHVVLDGVDLALPPGSLTLLAGANGAGKTTLMRIAAGMLAPNAGRVDLLGMHPRKDRRRFQQRLGYLSAGDRGLYARLSAREHLKLWARLALLPRGELEPAIERMVDRLSISQLLDRRTDRLSQGQRQRLRLAMAFLHDPLVVMLDEPLNSLDEAGAEALRACLADLTGRGGTALWCSPGGDRDLAPFDVRWWLERGALEAFR